MNLDFSPITSAPMYQSDKKSLDDPGKKMGKTIWMYILLAMTGVGLLYLAFLFVSNFSRWQREAAERRAAMKAFAERNGFSYQGVKMGFAAPGDEINEQLDLPYKPDNVMHFDVVRGTLHGYGFSYSISNVMRKKKDGQFAAWPTTILVIDLPVTLPKVFIDSKFNNMPGLGAPVLDFEQAEDHYLEGDFPNYYTVRIEKSQHIDMYAILTPEVMETLKHNNRYDVWLNGRQLVLLAFGDYRRYVAGAPEVFQSASMLMQEIDKIARALRRDAAAQGTPQPVAGAVLQ